MSRSRAGFQLGTATSAMAMDNERRDRNLREAAEHEGQPAGARRSRGGERQPGKLYSFGSGDYGRLGHSDHVSHKSPKLIETLRDKDIKKCACGPRHSLALTDGGKVYSAWPS